MTQNKTLKFSGHETFICKQFWPKKGFEFLKEGNSFSDPDSIVKLGVGKNMVTSIKHWMKALALIDLKSDQPLSIANQILDNKGFDPYLEDIGTIWLLHYLLVTSGYASIYHLVFNEYRKEKFEFTKEQLHNFLKRKILEEQPNSYSKDTINRDVDNFKRNYLPTNEQEGKVNIEEDYVGLLIDLNLLEFHKTEEGVNWYKIDSKSRNDLPYQIFLYSILDNPEYGDSIPFDDLRIKTNSPGLVFAMNNDGIYNKIEEVIANYEGITFSKTAGNQILQFNRPLYKDQILKDYYGK
jgi:hypothetical protein